MTYPNSYLPAMTYEVLCWGTTTVSGQFAGAYADRTEALARAEELTGRRLRNRRVEVWAVSEQGPRKRVFVSDRDAGNWFDIHVRARLRPSDLAERAA